MTLIKRKLDQKRLMALMDKVMVHISKDDMHELSKLKNEITDDIDKGRSVVMKVKGKWVRIERNDAGKITVTEVKDI